MTKVIEFSRPTAVAVALGGEDAQRFTNKRVLLCGETGILLGINGREAFLGAFLLLVRICEDVSISLPPECNSLRKEVDALAQRFVPKRLPRDVAPHMGLDRFDAILSVGTAARPDLPWTVINSDGWLARVSSLGASLPSPNDRANAISAVGAACLGVGEVFKRLIALRTTRGQLLDATCFSFWTYGLEQRDEGPVLDPLAIDVLLAGCGAIGSATAYLLSRLRVSGRAFALDRQCFQPENFGTSIIVGPDDYGKPKARVVADLLKPKLETQAFSMEIEAFGHKYDGGFPDTILAGLDDVAPRHQIQQLWPRLVIDGAVGSDLSCQVSCHPWPSEAACLLCLFQKQASANLAEMNALATGLPTEIANNPDALITEELIAVAPEDRKSWLRGHLGKRVCSITSEAVVKFLSPEDYREGFAPAVPFVSCFSACMIVTELARYVMTGATAPAPRFQLNFLWGPRRGVSYPEGKRENCFCVKRAENISRLREGRFR